MLFDMLQGEKRNKIPNARGLFQLGRLSLYSHRHVSIRAWAS